MYVALASPAERRRSLSGRVDVVIVTYNAERWIGACLESLVASGMALASVTVVDNASGDGTIDCIRDTFPEVRIICLERNVGYGAAANVALGTSTREYIVVLNQDVISTPGWIERLVAALDKDSTAGLATPRILLRADPTRVNACGTDVHYSGVTTCRGYGSGRGVGWHAPRNGDLRGRVHHPAVLGRAAQGFDPLFFMYVEDADLSLRAALHGVSACASRTRQSSTTSSRRSHSGRSSGWSAIACCS